MTLIRLAGKPFDGLPRRPSIASHIIDGAVWHRDVVQTAGDAIQIHTYALNDYRLELHIPPLPQAVELILSEVTDQHALSRQGRLAMALQTGADITVLREGGVFQAITLLTTPRSTTLLRELRKLKRQGSPDEEVALVTLAAEWGGRSERTYRTAAQLEEQLSASVARALERLCEQRWAERGLRVICAVCGLSSFVRLPEVIDQAACPGCHSLARYMTEDRVEVHYRLNTYLDRASDQGVLPHLLVAAALTAQRPSSYFLLGTEVRFADGTEKEVDVFGVWGGEVVAGEIKTKASDFNEEQVDRDVKLSKRLGADVHVLAAVDSVSSDAVTLAQRLCDEQGIKLLVLQESDLHS